MERIRIHNDITITTIIINFCNSYINTQCRIIMKQATYNDLINVEELNVNC